MVARRSPARCDRWGGCARGAGVPAAGAGAGRSWGRVRGWTGPTWPCRFGDADLPGSTLELYGSTSREITCDLDPGAPLEVGVADHWIGLPAEAASLVGPRPPDTMPVQSGNRPFDAALVLAAFQL